MNNKGFTITELLVATVIAGLVLAAVYSVFYSQQKSYAAQTEISGMQQNLRAAMFFLEKDLRLAGCNPTGIANVGIQSPLANNTIQLTMDITDDALSGNSDGDADDPEEDITYTLADFDGDGDNDLLRNGNMIAENVDMIDFRYLNAGGAVTSVISEIRSVLVTMVARTGKGDLGYIDANTYENTLGITIFTPPANDNHRRRLLSSEVQCRNLWF